MLKIQWFSDEFLKNSSSYFYQAATEMGGYGYDTKGLEDLLVAIPIDQDPRSLAVPNNMSVSYDGKLMTEVLEWLNAEGHKFIYLYGTRDYWSAGSVPPNKHVDSEWFFLKDKRHSETNVSEMTDSERKRMISILKNWLSLDIEDIFENN